VSSRELFNGRVVARRSFDSATATPVWITWALPLLALLLASLPLALSAVPPLFDYPNHLARADAMSRFYDDPALQSHFQLTSLLVPNVLSDIVLLVLMQEVDPDTAGRILIFVTFALTLGGIVALGLAAYGQVSPWALLGALFLTNEMFFWGFLNYNLGLALLLWAVAATLYLDEKPALLRLLAGTCFALLIFFAHLVAFGLFAVAVSVLECVRAWRYRRQAWAKVAGHAAVSVLQFVPALLLYFEVSPSSSLPLDPRFDFSAWGKLSPFTRLLSSGNPEMDVPVLIGATLITLGGLALRRAVLHRGLALASASFVGLVLMLPYSALGSFFLDSRIVIAAVYLLIASIAPRKLGPWGTGVVTAAALLLLIVRSSVLTHDWQEQSDSVSAVRDAFNRLPRGALLIAGSGAPFELGDWVNTRRIKPASEHLATYAVIDRNAIVPNLFARQGHNPLVYNSPLPAMRRLGVNPIPRVYDEDDFNAIANSADAVSAIKEEIEPPIPGVYVIVFHKTCSDWPRDIRIRPVACGRDFALVEVQASMDHIASRPKARSTW
jgi:hypothetical protein